MLIAAAGFAAGYHSGSATVGLVAGAGAGMLFSDLLGARHRRNQPVRRRSRTGRCSARVCPFAARLVGRRCRSRPPSRSGLADLPFLGTAVFRLHPMVYAALRPRAGGLTLARTRGGSSSAPSASRPSPRTPSAIPCVPSVSTRVAFGGLLRAGRRVPVAHLHPLWVEGMVAGTRLDRAGADHVRHLAAPARGAGCVPVRQRDDHDPVRAAGRGWRSLRNCCRCCPMWRPSWCWR